LLLLTPFRFSNFKLICGAILSTSRIDFVPPRISIIAVSLMRLSEAVLMAVLILPVNVLAQVNLNPRDINDFNVEPVSRHEVVVTSEVESAATPEEIAQALAGLDKEIAADPQNSRLYISRGGIKASTGNDTGAVSDLQRAIKLDPKNTAAYILLGEVQSDEKDYQGTVTTFTRALTIEPRNSDFFDNRGWAKKEKGDFNGAIADFSQVIALDPPTASRGYMGRGGAKFAKHDFDGAIADLTKVIELDPKNAAGAYGLRGNAKQSKGDLTGAKADWAASDRFKMH
jgi:tetratricopeptide (TPR) repeat protein